MREQLDNEDSNKKIVGKKILDFDFIFTFLSDVQMEQKYKQSKSEAKITVKKAELVNK